MPIDPLTVITEILGEPSAQMRNPANLDYQCPFLADTCVKRSQRITGPYPVCTIFHGRRRGQVAKPICVCPKRLYEIDLRRDVITNCWPGEPPTNPRIAHEVKMAGFGNVDFVIADVDEATQSVRQFVSVEMQAVDIVGSVEPAYSALISNRAVKPPFSYGINWANVRKRYITQLVVKGFYHHAWRSRIVAVLQTPTYNSIQDYIKFDELPASAEGTAINFMLYDYKLNPENGRYSLELDRVVSTSQSSLMTAAMYRQIPEKQVFCEKIITRMR